MSVFFWILLIIIIILIFLFAAGKLSGTILIIIILLIVILICIIPSIIGVATIGFLGNACMNNKCSVVKLPLDIEKIGQYNADNDLYSVKLKSDQ